MFECPQIYILKPNLHGDAIKRRGLWEVIGKWKEFMNGVNALIKEAYGSLFITLTT
jgi:hypothetical protein